MDTASDTFRVAIGPKQEHKIPPGDPYWPKFNASFKPCELPQVKIAEALYNGYPITTWHRNHWRHSKNYELGQHLGIDFDTEDKRSSLPHLLAEPFIAKHAAILHTTLSHTPDKPRARAVFLLDKPIYQPTNYILAATALLWVFGSADRQCKDAVRFFFGGKPGACEMEWPGHVLSLDLVKDLIRRYQASGARERRRVSTQYAAQNVDEQKVIDALRAIPAWGVEYDEWLAILMAIHSEFPGPNGESIADTWAQGYDGEVRRKWRSFSAEGNVAGRVGIGTLFARAKEHGWVSLSN